MARHTIYLNGRMAICPKCSGMITRINYLFGFHCIDCGASYRVISDDTVSERELVCEDMEIKN